MFDRTRRENELIMKATSWAADVARETRKSGGQERAVLDKLSPEAVSTMVRNHLKIVYDPPPEAPTKETPQKGTL